MTERAVIRLAESTARRGNQQAFQSAAQLLQAWLPHASSANFRAWMLSDLGLLKAACGQVEEGVALGREAVAQTLAEMEDNWYRRVDLARMLLRAGRAQQAQEALIRERPHPHYALTLAQAHHQIGKRDTAYHLAQEVFAMLENRSFSISEAEAIYYQPEAETLAEQL